MAQLLLAALALALLSTAAEAARAAPSVPWAPPEPPGFMEASAERRSAAADQERQEIEAALEEAARAREQLAQQPPWDPPFTIPDGLSGPPTYADLSAGPAVDAAPLSFAATGARWVGSCTWLLFDFFFFTLHMQFSHAAHCLQLRAPGAGCRQEKDDAGMPCSAARCSYARMPSRSFPAPAMLLASCPGPKSVKNFGAKGDGAANDAREWRRRPAAPAVLPLPPC